MMKRVISVFSLMLVVIACSGVNDSENPNSSSVSPSSTILPSSSIENSNSYNSSSSYSSSGLTSSALGSSSSKKNEPSSSSISSSSSTPKSDQIIIEGTMTDARDAKEYRTLTLGSQTWMAENLNYKTDTDSWCYDDRTMRCDTWGRLYSWSEMYSGRKLETVL